MTTLDEGALTGIRILDLADERAAYGVKLLADLGADVIKVEPPVGDRMRRFAPFVAGATGPESSLFFAYYATNRRSIVIDLESPADQDVFRGLAREADLIVETLPAGHLTRIGLGYQALAAENPRLILLSVTPFGQTGPRAGWRGGDLVAWATSGVMGVMGSPDREPIRAFNSQGNHWVGAWAAIGALGAIQEQRRSGLGQQVDLSMQEALALHAETSNLLWQYEGRRTVRQGNGHILAVPFGCFRCRDGWAAILAISQGQWATLLAWMREDGRGEVLATPEYETHHGRAANQPLIKQEVAAWTAQYTVDQLVAEGQRRRLPFGVAARLDQVAADPQLAARGYFREIDLPLPGGTRSVRFPGAPFPLGRGAWAIRRPAPRLDEHGVEIRARGWGEDEGLGFRGQGSGEGQALTPALSQRERAQSPARHPTPDTRHPRPLAGIRVADFTWALAGPWATRALADLGADVIKIEHRVAGDVARTFPPFKDAVAGVNRSGFFHFANRNKRSLGVDLKHPRGREIAERLIAWADVVVDNFSVGVMDRLGFGYERLREIRPDVIAISLSGFGQDGPRRGFVSYHATLTSLAGHTALTAYSTEEPIGFGQSFSDFVGGVHGAVALLAAIEHRRKTGEGQFIDAGQFEAVASILGPWLLDYTVNGHVAEPAGNRWVERRAGPHQAYPCAGDDRWIAIEVAEDEEWRALCTVADHPDWAADPRFATAADRFDHAIDLDALIGEWTRTQEMHALADRLQAAGVPAGAVEIAEDLLEDPHLAARDFWQPIVDPETGPVRLDGGPYRFSRTPLGVDRRPPLLGEQTEEILREVLGYSEEEYVELVVDEVV